MATRVEFNTSCLPVVTVAAEASGDNMPFETISYEIQRALGGGGTVLCNFTTVLGFNNGAVSYYSAAVSGGAISYPTTGGAWKFVHIKHTGYVYSSTTVLGVASTDNLNIYISLDSGSTNTLFAILSPGASLIIPVGTGLDFSTVVIGHRSSSATLTIAVEVMATT